METSESRITVTPKYPPLVYLESALIFFGANFLFHQNVFRRSGNRAQFAVFMGVNAFTSFQIAEAMSVEAARYHASAFNNTLELEHRANMSERLRKSLFRPTAAPQQ